jgi:hypothetical protein
MQLIDSLKSSVLISASLVLHGALFYSMDRGLKVYERENLKLEKKILKNKEDKIEFEFVEAPPKQRPLKPQKTSKVSNRDALNQDLSGKNKETSASPNTKVQGLADQLAQQRGNRLTRHSESRRSRDEESHHRNEILRRPGVYPERSRRRTPQDDVMVESKTEMRDPTVQSQPAPQELTGQDRITTQETSRFKSSGTKLYGLTSFEATGSGMGEYMKNLKERIWLSWFPYLAFQFPQEYRGADAVISFTLNREGEVKIVRLAGQNGSALFSTYCMEAVQKASGFGKLPEEILALIGKDELEIKFAFHYR